MKLAHAAIGVALIGMGIGTAQAASTTYLIDQSDMLADGSGYLRVTLTETDGGVDFRVETLDPLNSIAGANFGIHSFGFSLTSDRLHEIAGLPDQWRMKADAQFSEFGRYDIEVKSSDTSQTSDLRFNVGGTTLADFDGVFAAYIDGLRIGSDESKFRSGYFGGGSITAVPPPAAAWLFGSGLLGLFGVAHRRSREHC